MWNSEFQEYLLEERKKCYEEIKILSSANPLSLEMLNNVRAQTLYSDPAVEQTQPTRLNLVAKRGRGSGGKVSAAATKSEHLDRVPEYISAEYLELFLLKENMTAEVARKGNRVLSLHATRR